MGEDEDPSRFTNDTERSCRIGVEPIASFFGDEYRAEWLFADGTVEFLLIVKQLGRAGITSEFQTVADRMKIEFAIIDDHGHVRPIDEFMLNRSG